MKRKFWDLYAPVYQQAMRHDAKAYQFMYERILQKVKGKNVLELAAGPGLLAKHVAPAAHQMIATDYSPGMIRQAKKGKYPRHLKFAVADATALPYADASFDVVIMANALHIMDDPEKALAEIRRVMKASGLLIVPNFVNHAAGNAFWTAILKIAGIDFKYRWSEVDYLRYLWKQGWQVTFCKPLSARITVMYVECQSM